MAWNDLIELIAQQWQLIEPLEKVGVLFGMTQVLLAFRNSILTYPAGIISTTIFIWLFARPQTGLYADASLNVYYLVMSIYGWIKWSKTRHANQIVVVTHATRSDWTTAVLITIVAFATLFTVLYTLTDSTVPVWDSIVSAFAWSGMWLLAKRKVENWLFLNISNAIAIPLLFYKQMPLTALLTAFLFTIAVFGYFKWRRLATEVER